MPPLWKFQRPKQATTKRLKAFSIAGNFAASGLSGRGFYLSIWTKKNLEGFERNPVLFEAISDAFGQFYCCWIVAVDADCVWFDGDTRAID